MRVRVDGTCAFVPEPSVDARLGAFMRCEIKRDISVEVREKGGR